MKRFNNIFQQLSYSYERKNFLPGSKIVYNPAETAHYKIGQINQGGCRLAD